MKKLTVLVLALLAMVGCKTKDPNETVIRFEVENMTASEVLVLVDPTTNFAVNLDKHGKGEIVIRDLSNIYANIAYGQQIKPVFIGKGEEITLRFDGTDFRKGVVADGKNAAAAEYLQSMIFPEPPYYNCEFAEFRQKIDACYASAAEFVKARKLDALCPEFAAIELERLKYLYAQSYLMYPLGYVMTHEGSGEFKPTEEFYDILRELTVEREELMDVSCYRAFIQHAIPVLLENEGETFASGYERTLATIKYIQKNFKSDLMRQNMIRTLAIDYIHNSGIRNTAELQNIVNAYVTNPRYKEEYELTYTENDPTAKGNKSPDFTAVDLEGKTYSLKDFRGKYLYIDLWATWCNPCRAELPHLKALEEKLADRNITFLSLSVDKNKADWEAVAKTGVLSGKVLWLGKDNTFLEDYAVKGVPRFILLDTEGRVINSDMLRPSSKDTEGILLQLENI